MFLYRGPTYAGWTTSEALADQMDVLGMEYVEARKRGDKEGEQAILNAEKRLVVLLDHEDAVAQIKIMERIFAPYQQGANE